MEDYSKHHVSQPRGSSPASTLLDLRHPQHLPVGRDPHLVRLDLVAGADEPSHSHHCVV